MGVTRSARIRSPACAARIAAAPATAWHGWSRSTAGRATWWSGVRC